MHIGVATAGFQVEGGFNQRGQPTNNWADWEVTARVEASGPALSFWDDPDRLLDRAAAAGCDRFRLSFEWARVQPGFDIADGAPPPFDDTALDGYAALVVACRERGLEPMVTLLHFTHPRWLGVDLWGVSAKLPLFLDYVDAAVAGVNDRLVQRGHAPVAEWVTLNEVNALALAGGLVGAFPSGGRPGPGRFVRWVDHLLAAHCMAYDRIHDIYEQRRWETPRVTTNNYVFSAYHLDRMLVHLLLSRENGVTRDELTGFLAEGQASWAQSLARAPGMPRGRGERWAAELARRLVSPERLVFTLAALEGSPRPRKLDLIAIDWYDPGVARLVRLPGRLVGGARRWSLRAGLDEQQLSPPGLRATVHASSWAATGQPVAVVENGLCSLWPTGGCPRKRGDGLSRVDYLRLHLAELRRAAAEGAPVTDYYHWTVADNYEWGSYAPRFGLHAVDRAGGQARILDHDALGDDAAGEMARLAKELRGG